MAVVFSSKQPRVASIDARSRGEAVKTEEPSSRAVARVDQVERVETGSGERVDPSPGLFGVFAAFGAQVQSLLRRYARPVTAAMLGAATLPALGGAPQPAHAQVRPREETTTSPPTPDDAPLDPFTVRIGDGPRVSLIPSYSDLERWGLLSPGPYATPNATANATPNATPNASRTSHPQRAPSGRDTRLDTLLTGVPYAARTEPWQADFDSYFRARAALGEVPTSLAGMALRPVADRGYQIVDLIPAPIRRPFDRALGILLDNAISLPANLLTARVLGDTGTLPESANISLQAYPQIRNSCGETMIATWLKGQGVPIALGEIDTQTPFLEGTNLLEDAELRNRGYSLISGPGTMRDLRTYLAHGYPVMVSLGWPNGGGHYAVVTGYDDATRTLEIAGYDADGRTVRVAYDEFAENWGRHLNLMTVAAPQRDARLDELRRAGRVSRTARVQEGLSLSDIWVTRRLEFFVEAAYRYRGTADDLTIRLNLNTSERELGVQDMLGGSFHYIHRFEDGTSIDLYAEHLSTKGPDDAQSFGAFVRSSAAYAGVQHGRFAARAGYDRGAFQAAFQKDLNRRLFDVGAEARVSVGLDGSYRVVIGAQGTF